MRDAKELPVSCTRVVDDSAIAAKDRNDATVTQSQQRMSAPSRRKADVGHPRYSLRNLNILHEKSAKSR